MRKVTVQVPASTANLGPGFDTLGLALSLYNILEVEEAEQGVRLTIEGEGRETLTQDGTKNLASRAALAAFEQIGYRLKGLRLRLINRIPLRRGLGSSGTAILGGITAAARLAGAHLPPEAILRLAVTFEGHPDNVTPSLLGGFTASALVEEEVLYARLPFPEGIKAVAVIPAIEIPTQEARRILPEEVPLRDAVFNLSRQALMVAAFVTGRLELLAEGSKDRLHQPYRARLLPGMLEVMEEGLNRGALACFLSGAGSTIIALVRDGGEEIGERMRELWHSRFRIEASSRMLDVDRQGLIVFDE